MPPTKDQIEARVNEALVEFGAESDQITHGATFEALDIDSLDLVELAQIVEEDYGVEITGEDMKNINTVGQAIDFVDARTS